MLPPNELFTMIFLQYLFCDIMDCLDTVKYILHALTLFIKIDYFDIFVLIRVDSVFNRTELKRWRDRIVIYESSWINGATKLQARISRITSPVIGLIKCATVVHRNAK